MATTLKFTGSTVALIVRGKTSAAHEPGNMAQHSDVILADGSPMGFFGGEGGASSGSASSSWSSIGMNMKGFVADYAGFMRIRPFYVDGAQAKRYKKVSTVLVVPATISQATAFALYWKKLQGNPGSFHLLGSNCSSHASEAFVESGILAGGIPGLDTPNNLYKQLVSLYGKKTQSHSGFVGFTARPGGGGYDVTID